MQKYDMVCEYDNGYMAPDRDGGWCRAEDVDALIADLEALRDAYPMQAWVLNDTIAKHKRAE